MRVNGSQIKHCFLTMVWYMKCLTVCIKDHRIFLTMVWYMKFLTVCIKDHRIFLTKVWHMKFLTVCIKDHRIFLTMVWYMKFLTVCIKDHRIFFVFQEQCVIFLSVKVLANIDLHVENQFYSNFSQMYLEQELFYFQVLNCDISNCCLFIITVSIATVIRIVIIIRIGILLRLLLQ